MVIRTLLLFLPVAGLLAGCRTYVGYDPIVKQESRICRENAVLEHSRYGVNCQWSWDRTILTFGTVATFSFHRVTREWETGKTEYFLSSGEDRQRDSVAHLLAGVILWPLLLIDDTLHLASPWHLREHGTGVCTAAYLPPFSWFAAPLLRPPYASCFQKDPILEKEEVQYASPRLTTIRITPIQEESFLPDKSQSIIELRYRKKTIRKTLDTRGRFLFSLRELEPDGLFPPRRIEFQLHHRQRGMGWRIELFSLCTPELLRDWNLAVDDRYDFLARFYALFRLRSAIGASAYRTLAGQLIQGKPLSLSRFPTAAIRLEPLSSKGQ